MVFVTTVVVNGHAEGIVTETGMNTKVGKIAKMIITDEAPQTPIQRNLAEVGKALGIGCLLICAFIFVIGLIKKISPEEMFMTSVGLAVAAIPEGLPAIVTIMLSIGVTKMAKKNSIIRKLPAVETLGSSSVICSDKTGTLTQNKMQVVSIENVNGKVLNQNEKEFILELASICTDVDINYDKGKEELIGEPTEIAIVSAANNVGKNKIDLLYDEPIMTINKMAEYTGIKLTTINGVVNAFLEKNIIKETTGYSRNQIFAFEKYIDLFLK